MGGGQTKELDYYEAEFVDDVDDAGQKFSLSSEGDEKLIYYSEIDNIFYELGENVEDISPPQDFHFKTQTLAKYFEIDEYDPEEFHITEQQAREALVEEMGAECCTTSNTAQDMTIVDIKNCQRVMYVLETFTESRKVSEKATPYIHDEKVDGPENGIPPSDIWGLPAYYDHTLKGMTKALDSFPLYVPVEIANLILDYADVLTKKFQTSSTKIKLPHTERIETCKECSGNGVVVCKDCKESESKNISDDQMESVDVCITASSICEGVNFMETKEECERCLGDGVVECTICRRTGLVKIYKITTVIWKTHRSYKLIGDPSRECRGVPDQIIGCCRGKPLFLFEGERLLPLQCSENSIVVASYRAIGKHQKGWPNELTLLQRHRVEVVPIFKVRSRHNMKDFEYYVVGLNKQVHAPNYPAERCGVCTIS